MNGENSRKCRVIVILHEPFHSRPIPVGEFGFIQSQSFLKDFVEREKVMWDVFISHASEDKEKLVRPLAEALTAAGLSVWYDDFTLKLGDSLRRSIDRGLTESRYGIVILSPHFFAKEWPQRELDGLTAREVSLGKIILPVWHNVSRAEVVRFSPILADKLAVSTEKGLETVVREILNVFKEEPRVPEPRPKVRRGIRWGLVVAATIGLLLMALIGMRGYVADSINDAFVEAARKGRTDVLRILVKAVDDPNTINNAFVAAAREGKLDVLRILAKAADVKKVGPYALLQVAHDYHDRSDTIQTLLDLGVDPNTSDERGFTPLILASYRGRAATVRALLNKGADINAECDCRGLLEGGWTPLSIATAKNHSEVVKILLARNPDVTKRNHEGRSALIAGAYYDADTGTLRALLDSGADVNARDDDGATALMYEAGFRGQVDNVRLLLAKGADVNATDNKGWTALMWAAWDRQTATVRTLLDKGAKVNAQNAKGQTALMLAVNGGRWDPELMRALAEHGADVNAQDKYGRTALQFLEEYPESEITSEIRLEMIWLLKKAGAK